MRSMASTLPYACRKSCRTRTKHGKTFDITAHNYPQDAQSAHELENIVKSLLPQQEEWDAPVPATK